MLTCVSLSAWNFTRGANPPDVLDELKAWATAFTFSWDFFGDLKHYGLADDKAVRRAAKAAWKRLGARFMATWEPTPARKTPWALDKVWAMMLISRCRLIASQRRPFVVVGVSHQPDLISAGLAFPGSRMSRRPMSVVKGKADMARTCQYVR